MCWIYQEANDIQGGVSPTHFMQVLSVWADILKCFDTWIWSHAAKLQCYVLSYSLNKVFCFCFKQKKIKDSPALSPNHPALCYEVFCFPFFKSRKTCSHPASTSIHGRVGSHETREEHNGILVPHYPVLAIHTLSGLGFFPSPDSHQVSVDKDDTKWMMAGAR